MGSGLLDKPSFRPVQPWRHTVCGLQVHSETPMQILLTCTTQGAVKGGGAMCVGLVPVGVGAEEGSDMHRADGGAFIPLYILHGIEAQN